MKAFNTPLDAFLHWESETPNRTFLKQPIDGRLLTYTFKEAADEARKMANAFRSLGLNERDHIAILSKNCAHWIIADIAIMMANCVSIPIYPTLNADSIHQILTHSEAKAIIIGKLDDYESQKSGIPDIHKIGVSTFGIKASYSWEDLVSTSEIREDLPNLDENDLHTIIYTSGTTGTPKGVMHTYSNFLESVSTILQLLPLPEQPRLISYLPLAHVAERVGIGTHGMFIGAEFSFAESLDTFAANLEECQPHLFFAVPRIWGKFKDKILEKLPQKKLNTLLAIPIISTIIKKKLKQKLGIKAAKFVVSGAAPLSIDIIKWFGKIGVDIFQVYGMTEDCIISHAIRPGLNKIGTVGKVVPNVQIKLTPEDEIFIKNDCLFKGYYKAPELTAKVFDDEGYFKTGDKGEYDHDGYLSIIGRAKDEFKTDKGKYISPSHLELQLSKNLNIEQICIVGTGIPQPIALITLSEVGESSIREDLINSLEQSVLDLNPKVEKHEKIEKVVVMKEDWTVDNGLITPTLKVKRNAIEKLHQQFYKSWFDLDEKIIFE